MMMMMIGLEMQCEDGVGFDLVHVSATVAKDEAGGGVGGSESETEAAVDAEPEPEPGPLTSSSPHSTCQSSPNTHRKTPGSHEQLHHTASSSTFESHPH
jgi:hypothetical protein